MSKTAIFSENLTRDFGAVRALDGVSLEVPAGTIFGFLGPNGAGKTTTINILLGLIAPTSGHAEVMGFDTTTHAEAIRARTGALLEHTGIYEHLSAEDNLEFYGRVWNIPSSERSARIRTLLTHMGLWERRKDLAGTWSRGMKQKLALARVILHNPELVLLDEPTAGLDVVSSNTIRDDLESLTANDGTTVFLTTHNMAEAERLCSQVAVLKEGRIVAVGHPDSLRARAGRPRIEIVGRGFSETSVAALEARPEIIKVDVSNGHMAIDLAKNLDAAPLIGLLVQAGVQVEEVRRGAASLEDVYLTMMEEEK
jgi:ABC-2 type transport system ATP-binding protein